MNSPLHQEDIDILIIAAIFHDIVYNPKSKTNEEDSIIIFQNSLNKYKKSDKELKVKNIIKSTKNHKFNTKLEKIFCQFDLKILNQDLPELLKWEEQIFKEYEFLNWKIYKTERIKILQKFIDNKDFPTNKIGLKHLIYILENKEPSIALYAGSFNPFHLGHLDIKNKSERLFDKVIIAKGKNNTKQINDLEFENEFNKLQKLFPYNEIISYSGLLTDILKKQEGQITLIRGLRNGYDLDAENILITYMRDIYPELKVVYIPCDKKFEYISSSNIRNLKKYGDDLIQKYLP
jgi:pantetheine-phosphate adenylyltransferase